MKNSGSDQIQSPMINLQAINVFYPTHREFDGRLSHTMNLSLEP